MEAQTTDVFGLYLLDIFAILVREYQFGDTERGLAEGAGRIRYPRGDAFGEF